MSTLKKLVLWLFIIMIIAFTVSGYFFNRYGVLSENTTWNDVFSNMEEQTPNFLQTQEFDMTDVEYISINSISEDVIIQQSDEVKKATVTLSGYASDKAVDLDIKKTSDKIDIKVEHDGLFTNKLTLKIIMPSSQLESITINTTSGDCDADIYQCDLFEFKTVSGDLNSSSLYADTIKLNSTSGDIRLSSTNANLIVRTTSGDLETYYENFNNSIDIKTVSGDVRLSFETPVDFDLDFKTTSGDHDINTPVKISSSGDHGIKAISGDGSNPITVNSTSGDLRIH